MSIAAETVLELLGLLRAEEIEVWLDGGWGVDALLGRETRLHEDLDVVVEHCHVERIRDVLGKRGFRAGADEMPVRFVLEHPTLGSVDFHPVRFDAGGGGVQDQSGGGSFRYPPEGFTEGAILGGTVPCLSPEVQVLCHAGYEPGPKDVHDMVGLREAFGVALSAAYPRCETEDEP